MNERIIISKFMTQKQLEVNELKDSKCIVVQGGKSINHTKK